MAVAPGPVRVLQSRAGPVNPRSCGYRDPISVSAAAVRGTMPDGLGRDGSHKILTLVSARLRTDRDGCE
ncbi:hypothetical protein C5F51_12275 [Nocardia nova]|uniref:Uncharacterized protein n=1 Tax=Nocardia nova TaxID=37330 RepID=A0A2S6A864_9NOCA|nr:hypothetical protein C5F51_12275 [Nocardia nova]